jgi:F-type H+-transporting ATPase subunit epsilon
MKQLKVQVISQEKPLLDTFADLVLIPGANGQLGILPDHIPLITKLQAGVVTIRRQRHQDTLVAIGGGFAAMEADNTLSILADTATKAEDISLREAEAAKERAQATMKQAGTVSEREFKLAEAQLRRALVELQVARKHKTYANPRH